MLARGICEWARWRSRTLCGVFAGRAFRVAGRLTGLVFTAHAETRNCVEWFFLLGHHYFYSRIMASAEAVAAEKQLVLGNDLKGTT